MRACVSRALLLTSRAFEIEQMRGGRERRLVRSCTTAFRGEYVTIRASIMTRYYRCLHDFFSSSSSSSRSILKISNRISLRLHFLFIPEFHQTYTVFPNTSVISIFIFRTNQSQPSRNNSRDLLFEGKDKGKWNRRIEGTKRRNEGKLENWRTNGKIVRRNEGTRRIELSCPYCAMLVSPITIAGGLYEKREARGVGE